MNTRTRRLAPWQSRLLTFVLGMFSVALALVNAFADPPAPLDQGAAKTYPDAPGMLWYDVQALGIEGRGWSETKTAFDRLPAKAEGVVRPGVWGLSQHSAGLCVRFHCDSPQLAVQWKLRSSNLAMNHMAATGVSGVDLYARGDDDKWHWLAVGRPSDQTNRQTLAGDLPTGREREFLLYLPLYNGVEEVRLGLPQGVAVRPGEPRPALRARPIVFYGTSITQGGCAARPGMAYPAILGRRLERETINLGFSGSGKMEPEMAALLAELDPAAFVLDALPNNSAAETNERLVPLVKTIRAARAHTPIVLVENITYQSAPLSPRAASAGAEKNVVLRELFQGLVREGLDQLHYVEGPQLLGDDGEGTVDGTHPTDLGFLRMADAMTPTLVRLFSGAGER